MSSNPPGRQSQGRPVTQDQYAKERGLPAQNPMVDPAGVSYPPGSAPLNNPSMADSFFFQEPDKSSFLNDGQQSVMVNPYTQPAAATNQVKKVSTTTVTTTQQTTSKLEPKGFNNPYTTTPAPPVMDAGRSSAPILSPQEPPLPAGRSTLPAGSQFKLVSSKMQYDNTISPDADDLLRKSGVTGASKIVATETVTKRETVNPAFQGKSLQERFDFLSTKTRDQEWKIHELEDRIASMTLERDKMINDYEAYIDKLTMEKEELKGLEGLVRKLEAEKEFLENEIEKVRSIKLMLENQLNAYNENAEIMRYRAENEKLKEDMKRLKHLIFVETGQTGDPNRLDIRGAITKFKSEVTVVQQENQRVVSERNDLLRKIAVLEDELKFHQGDANTEIRTLRNTVESYKKQIANLQEAHADIKRTEAGSKSQLNGRIKILEQENETLRKNIESMRTNMKHADDSVSTQEIRILRERIHEMTVNTPHVGEIEQIRGQLQLNKDKVQRLEERNQFLEQQLALMAAQQPGDGNNQALVNQIRALNERVRNGDQQNFELNNRLIEAQRQIDELRRNQVTNITQTNYSGSAVATNNRGNMENRGPGGNYLGTGGVNQQNNNQSRVETTTVTTEYVHVNDGTGGQLRRVTPTDAIEDDDEPLNSQNTNRVTRKKQVQFAPGNSTYMYQHGSEGPEAGDASSSSQTVIKKVNTTFINNTSNIDGSALSFGQNSDSANQSSPLTFAGSDKGVRGPVGSTNHLNTTSTVHETNYEYYIDESGQQQRRPSKIMNDGSQNTNTNSQHTVTMIQNNQSSRAGNPTGSFGDLDQFGRINSNNQQGISTNISSTVVQNTTIHEGNQNFNGQQGQMIAPPIMIGNHGTNTSSINNQSVHHTIVEKSVHQVDNSSQQLPHQMGSQVNSQTVQRIGFGGNNNSTAHSSQQVHHQQTHHTLIDHQHTQHLSNHNTTHSHHQNHHHQQHHHQQHTGAAHFSQHHSEQQAKLDATAATNTTNVQLNPAVWSAVQQSQIVAEARQRTSPSRLPEQMPAFPTHVLEPSFVRQSIDHTEQKVAHTVVDEQKNTAKTTQLEGVLAKKQREIDDLLMRVFLLAAENDRLRNEDQLLQNIRTIRNSPLVQRSMEVNKLAREKDPVNHESNTYHSITKVIPQVNSIGGDSAQQIGLEMHKTQYTSNQEVRASGAVGAGYNPWHAEQAYENKDNSDIHLFQRYQRTNRDVESIIQEVYEKHGLTKELSSSKPNPHRPTIATRIEQTYALAHSSIPAHELRKTELDDYFKKINQKLMENDSNAVILERVASPERDPKHDAQLAASVLRGEHA